MTEGEPTSHANEAVGVAQRGFDLFNAGDLEGFFAIQHPDIVLVPADEWPERGVYAGIDEFKRYLAQFLEPFDEVRWEPARAPEAIGSAALFRGHWTGTGATTGIEGSSVDFSVVFTVRDGLIRESRFFVDDEEARRVAAELADS